MKLLKIVSGLCFLIIIFSNTLVTALPSENVVILQVQAFGDGTGPDSSYEEFVLLYNSSEEDINVSGWCLEYISATGVTVTKLSCIDPPNIYTQLWLASGGYISFATEEFVGANIGFESDFDFFRKLANTSGHLVLLNNESEEIDRLGWGDAVYPEGFATGIHNGGEVMSRDLLAVDFDTDVNLIDFSSQVILSPIVSGIYEQEVVIDMCPNIEELQLELPVGYLQDEIGDCFEDFCPNLDGLQLVAPIGFEKLLGAVDCTELVLEDAVLFITELLPNAPSTDTGKEFIELFNPNDKTIDLTGYRLQLGPSFSKEFVFTSGEILPAEYLVFSDTITNIVLPNSTGAVVRLLAPAGNTVSQSASYMNASDDVSWALVEDFWIFTNQITPASANKPYLVPVVDEVAGVTSIFAPCPAGKFRNPETNRCKSLETAVSVLTPCDEDEFRNPETNRCKKLVSSTSSLAPCPEGQERNPDTNRCRNVAVLGSATELATVTDIVVESGEGQLNWPIILASIGGTFAYMLYEWRNELSHRFRQVRAR